VNATDHKKLVADAEQAMNDLIDRGRELQAARESMRAARHAETSCLNAYNQAHKRVDETRKAINEWLKKEIPL
jgi:hypothetical protein